MDEDRYGYATNNDGDKIIISDFLRASYTDHRLVSIATLDDETYVLSIENPSSSGRAVTSTMRLSKDSFAALISTAHLFWLCKEENLTDVVERAIGGDVVDFEVSDNLKIPDCLKKT